MHAPRAGEPGDVFVGGAPRPFNYLLVYQDEVGIRVDTRGFPDSETATTTLESTLLEFPRP